MNRSFSLAAFVLATVSVPATPLTAVGQTARARGTQSGAGQAVPRGENPRGNTAQPPPQPQAQRPPQTQAQRPPQPQAQRARQPQAQRAPLPQQPAAAARMPPTRRIEVPAAQPVPRNGLRSATPGVVAPQVVAPQVVVPRVAVPRVDVRRPNDHPAYRPDYRPQYRPGYPSSYYSGYRPPYRPYYTFRPRVRLGFGVWVGYPVTYPHYAYAYAYPYSYPYPYPSTPPYPYTYSYPVSIYSSYSSPGAAPVAASGGLSFDIQPPQAAVYIDGRYVGVVSQFSPDQPPLSLAPGRHHVEIREPGFEIVAFDVDITPGEVIPYHGDLRRF